MWDDWVKVVELYINLNQVSHMDTRNNTITFAQGWTLKLTGEQWDVLEPLMKQRVNA